MEGYFELNPSPGEGGDPGPQSWPAETNYMYDSLPPEATTSHKRGREDDVHPSMPLNVMQYDPMAPEEDEYIDPDEAGPMEEGESVLRLGGRKGGASPKKKRATTAASSQRLLSELQVDEDGKAIGRRKIQIEFIQDKSRRHITFSKRKAGIMKKVRFPACAGQRLILALSGLRALYLDRYASAASGRLGEWHRLQ
jgi:hypothetical protein